MLKAKKGRIEKTDIHTQTHRTTTVTLLVHVCRGLIITSHPHGQVAFQGTGNKYTPLAVGVAFVMAAILEDK